jgi:hypothetical protein
MSGSKYQSSLIRVGAAAKLRLYQAAFPSQLPTNYSLGYSEEIVRKALKNGCGAVKDALEGNGVYALMNDEERLTELQRQIEKYQQILDTRAQLNLARRGHLTQPVKCIPKSKVDVARVIKAKKGAIKTSKDHIREISRKLQRQRARKNP